MVVAFLGSRGVYFRVVSLGVWWLVSEVVFVLSVCWVCCVIAGVVGVGYGFVFCVVVILVVGELICAVSD